MLQGLSDLIDVNSYGDGNVASTMGEMAGNLGFSLVGQTVPTVLGQFARTIDPIGRRSNSSDKEGKLEKYVGYNLNKNVLSKIPFANQKRQEYVDQWGRTEEKTTTGDYIKSGLENFLSPSYTGNLESTPVDKEISKLYEQNKNNDILPPKYNKYDITFKTKDYRMSGDEIVQYKKTKGQYAYEGLYTLFKSERYKNMSTDDKEKAIRNVYDESSKKAKSEFLKTKGVDEADVWLKDLGKQATSGYETMKVSPEDYYKTYREMLNRTNEVGSDANIYKALALSEMGADEGYYDAFGVTSNSTDFRALTDNFKQNNITAEDYYKYRLQADLDSNNSIKKVEAVHMLEQENLTREQKRVLFTALCPTVKYNPY
jgi:hypothetical protein